ncbi:MAG: ROK family protein [Candidatus Izemoplasmatales bacterium]
MEKFIFNQKSKIDLPLDKDFSPIIMGNIAYEKALKKTDNPVLIRFAIERGENQVSMTESYIFNDIYQQEEANFIYIERLIKTILWIKGGYKIYFAGHSKLGQRIKDSYQKGGLRDFDQDFMSKVYEKPFEVKLVNLEEVPMTEETSKSIGRHLNGSRIGFDAGGSDRKVSSVVDGKAIFSEEVIWHPKEESDPNYHYQGIMDSLKRAASKLERVDAIGVSSAGIFINNRVAVASLFRKVPQELFDKDVRDLYYKIQKEFNNVPIEVINDGDVTALAGSMSLESNRVLGIAMGTSQAAGYVNALGNITGWLNELSFVPVDYNPNAPVDEWSHDYGVGVNYFSQDAVIKLAKAANIHLDESLSPAEKLKFIQGLAEKDDALALEIFKTIGVYLGYSIAYYAQFYDISHVLILGRVTSGIGGIKILEYTNKVLNETFTELANQISVNLPDEKSRRVGQSIAAASLPKI